MDPFTIKHLAHDRILDLQRTADQVRRERALRPPPSGEAEAPPTRQAEMRRAPDKAGRCSPAEPAI